MCCTIRRKEGIILVIKSEKDKERGRFEKYEHYEIVKIRHRKHIKTLLLKYHAEYAILFGSYARCEESVDSDIDVVVVGGANFRAKDIFAFGEELRELTNKNVDAFEIREINKNTEFYDNVMREGVRIA